MSYLNVLDEGAPVQDHCVQMDFVGAGVAATRPSSNDRVTVTIPGAADVSGWTDDGAVVRLTTVGDRVAIGAAVSIGTEKVRVVNAAGVAIRAEGRVDLPNVSVAAAAASQARSYVQRFTASMWVAAGNAEAERDFDLYAAPSILTDDETTARAELAIDYEGFRLLNIIPEVAAPVGVGGVIFQNDAAEGGFPNFEFRVGADFGAGDVLWITDNNGAGQLFMINGNGDVTLHANGSISIGANQIITTRQPAIADVADGVDVGPDNVLRADVRALKAMLRTHGLMSP